MNQKNTYDHSPVQHAFKAFVESTLTDQYQISRLRSPNSDETELGIRFMKASLDAEADEAMAQYLTNPLDHINDESVLTEPALRKGCARLAAHFIRANPTDISAKCLIDRLRMILEKSFETGEIQSTWHNDAAYFGDTYYDPKANECLELLLENHSEIPGVREFVLALINGTYLKTATHEDYDRPISNFEVLFGIGSDSFENFAQGLFTDGLLDQDIFRGLSARFPDCITAHRGFPAGDPSDSCEGTEADEDFQEDVSAMPPGYVDAYRELVGSLARELCTKLPDSAPTFAEIFGYVNYTGLYWLEQGLIQIRDHEMTARALKSGSDHSETVQRMLAIVRLEPNETDEDLMKLLAGFDQKLLSIALPYAQVAKTAMMQALGMTEFVKLDAFITKSSGGQYEDKVYNSADTENGLFDVVQLKQVTQGLPEKKLATFLKEVGKGKSAPTNTIMLVTAGCGLDRAKIEKKLVRHGQTAIKAYGLFPVIDAKELRDRYVHFKKMHKEASQYGAERQMNTRAAVAVGLKNLARVAGFTDETRMEWALEADLADNATKLNEWHEIADWSICLQLEGISPKIAIRKGEKTLKSVPPKVRQDDAYKAMRESQDQIRGQASRFKNTLQRMMCTGDSVTNDELETLQRLPIVATLLSRLILQSADGTLGLFDGNGKLRQADGSLIPITHSVRIAHPWHIFEASAVPVWQRLVVEQKIIQPFKQAFRELYIVTPAEVNSVDTSRRFDGQVVDSAIASRLLQGRDWQLAGYEDGDPCVKQFPGFSVNANIDFSDVGHYFSESSEVTMGEIQFYSHGERIPMADVHPLIFSEVMRDADLIAGVAQVTESDERWSTEVATRRAELVTTMIEIMGMNNVSCDGKFARIKGQLASYRIHLGSGAIHIEPGNYLCIVPAGGSHKDGLYLPFADTDAKMREILSKVLLLSNDDKIKDKNYSGSNSRSPCLGPLVLSASLLSLENGL